MLENKNSQNALDSIRGFEVILILSLIPAFILGFTLIQKGVLNDSINALRGNYFIGGASVNPWGGFAPYIFVSGLTFIACSWFVTSLVKRTISISSWSWYKVTSCLVLSLLASLAFGISNVFASLSYLWFQDTIVLGVPNSLDLFGLSAGFVFIVLMVNYYRLLKAGSALGSI